MDAWEKDKKLETKEGRTMLLLVQKPPIPLSPQKTPCYADVFSSLPKTRNRPNQQRKNNQNQLYIRIARGGEGELKL